MQELSKRDASLTFSVEKKAPWDVTSCIGFGNDNVGLGVYTEQDLRLYLPACWAA